MQKLVTQVHMFMLQNNAWISWFSLWDNMQPVRGPSRSDGLGGTMDTQVELHNGSPIAGTLSCCHETGVD